MFAIIGILVVMGAVVGGYLIEHGKIGEAPTILIGNSRPIAQTPREG